jgi:hypothetical protein
MSLSPKMKVTIQATEVHIQKLKNLLQNRMNAFPRDRCGD